MAQASLHEAVVIPQNENTILPATETIATAHARNSALLRTWPLLLVPESAGYDKT